MIIMRFGTITLTGVVVAWWLNREREQRRALAATTAEQLALSRERNRVARELHDTLAHSLSGVTAIFTKLNMSDRTQAAVIALRHVLAD